MKYDIIDSPYPPIGSGISRSEGLHLTDVIKYIEKKLDAQYKGTGFKNQALTMDIGFLWENVLSYVYGSLMALRPGEIICDGISCSPDGIGYDEDICNTDKELIVSGTGQPCVEEYKATWKSTKTSPTDVWYYMTQVKSYAYVLGLNIVVMRIIYLMGDWKGSGPQYRVCRIVFEDDEIENNWKMITKYAEEMQR